ncbi:MAG: hypothetical protein ACYS47_12890 [Planctomycetota bacterium]|jgi:hypothetical protein
MKGNHVQAFMTVLICATIGCGKLSPPKEAGGGPSKPKVTRVLSVEGVRILNISESVFRQALDNAGALDPVLAVKLPAVPSGKKIQAAREADGVIALGPDGGFVLYDFRITTELGKVVDPYNPKALVPFTGAAEEMRGKVKFFARLARYLDASEEKKEEARRALVEVGPRAGPRLRRLASDWRKVLREEKERCRFNAKGGDAELARLTGMKKKTYARFLEANEKLLSILEALPDDLPAESAGTLEGLRETVETTEHFRRFLPALANLSKSLKKTKPDLGLGLFLDEETEWGVARALWVLCAEESIEVLHAVRSTEESLRFISIRTGKAGADSAVRGEVHGEWNPRLKKTKYRLDDELLGYGEAGIAKAAESTKKRDGAVGVVLPDETEYGEALRLLASLDGRGIVLLD